MFALDNHDQARSATLPVGYRVIEQPKLAEILTHPSVRWPFHVGMLSGLRVLHGQPENVKEWIALGKAVPLEAFRSALEIALPELVVEPYGRILSCRDRRNTRDIGHAVVEVLYEMRTRGPAKRD